MYRILIFGYRKRDITPDEFEAHYEQKHIPLVKAIAGSQFPLSHTRHYIRRVKSDSPAKDGTDGDNAYPAAVLSGSQAQVGFDAVAELKFNNQAEFFSFSALLALPANAAKIAEDCEQFMDTAKTTLVELSNYVQTTPDS
jgi:hypothetical protein